MHEHFIRVYYEDTDSVGIVYYANYFKFIERARTELLRECGINHQKLYSDFGLKIAVWKVEAHYIHPAMVDDQLSVVTYYDDCTGAKIKLQQFVRRSNKVLFESLVTLVCIDRRFRPARIPLVLRNAVKQLAE